jgi:hypothetical protein
VTAIRPISDFVLDGSDDDDDDDRRSAPLIAKTLDEASSMSMAAPFVKVTRVNVSRSLRIHAPPLLDSDAHYNCTAGCSDIFRVCCQAPAVTRTRLRWKCRKRTSRLILQGALQHAEATRAFFSL